MLITGCVDSPSNGETTEIIYTEQEIETNQLIGEARQIINSGNYRVADSMLVTYFEEFQNANYNYGILETVIEHGYLMAVTGRLRQAIQMMEDQKDLLESEGSNLQQYKFYARLSSLYNADGNRNEALDMIEHAIRMGADELSTEQYIGAISTKASILSGLNRIAETIDLYQEAIVLSIEHGTSVINLATIHNNLGLQLHQLKRYEQALEEYEKSYKINITNNNIVGLGLNLNNIANTYHALNQTDAAIDTLRSAIALNSRTGNTASLIRNYYNLGDSFYRIGDWEEAERYFLKSYDLSAPNGFKPGIMYNSSGLAKIRREKGDYRGAITLGQESLDLAKELGELEVELSASEIVMTSREALGDYRGALEMRKHHNTINDSLWNIKSAKEIEEVRSSFQFNLLENEKELLEQNLILAEVQNRRQLLYLILLFVVMLAMSSFYLMLNRKNRQIAEKNNKLEQLNEERGILTKVVVHDMRNPLTALLGSIELLAGHSQLDQHQLTYLNIASQSGAKLKYMINGFLNAMQIQQETIAQNMIPFKVDELTRDIIDSMNSMASAKNITIKSNIQSVKRITYPEYFSHILENLLSNAIKFSPNHSTITVELRNIDEHRWKLEVKDEGPGFSEQDLKLVFKMFQKLSARPTNGEESTGLGLYLVQLITKKLNGKIDILSEQGKGASIICTFVEAS